MPHPGRLLRLLAAFALFISWLSQALGAETMRAVLFSADQATLAALQSAKTAQANAIGLALQGRDEAERKAEKAAAERIGQADLGLYYWIEIARCPELAEAHPEWMASLQGHPEWRRLFPDAPKPQREVEVIKNYPWVPVLYQEAFAAHQKRVKRLLEGLPAAHGIFLNGLQGAPSACGCGNTLCRWTADYGPLKTATPKKPDAAAQFVKAVGRLAPQSQIIPVWVTECEKHDGAKDGLCAGVGCFKGICWEAYTEQLMPLAEQAPRIAVLLPFREFGRDLRLYGKRAGWISQALATFQTMPPRHGGKAIGNERLITVLQGWQVTEEEVAAQVQRAKEAGAAGWVISRKKLDQSWQPRLHKLPPANQSQR